MHSVSSLLHKSLSAAARPSPVFTQDRCAILKSTNRVRLRATGEDEIDGEKQQPNGANGSDDSNQLGELKSKFFSSSPPPSEQDEVEQQAKSGAAGPDLLPSLVNPIALGRQVRKAFDQAFNEDGSSPSSPSSSPSTSSSMAPTSSSAEAPGGNVNPINLGRQARRAFDEVWSAVSNLTSPTKSYIFDDEVLALGRQEEDVPQAASTTVLLLGATGRVGRILTRKLLLRGYKVKALVRRKEGRGQAPPPSSPGQEQDKDSNNSSAPPDQIIVEGVPPAVKIVFGDVGEMRDCQEAVRGVNKVIYCASSRSTFTGELLRVEEVGMKNISKAFQDECWRQAISEQGKRTPGVKTPIFTSSSKKEIADFSRKYHQGRWDVTFIGCLPADEATQSDRAREMSKYNQAIAEINEEDNLIFEGVLYQRDAIAEVGAKISSLMPGGEHRTLDTEGLTMRLRGDGKQYTAVLQTEEGHKYTARFPTKTGYLHIRMPWTSFRPESPDLPPLSPENISYMGIKYEFKRSPQAAAARAASRGAPPTPEEVEAMKKDRQFQIEIDWIKALPGGKEPQVILVSCAGKGSDVTPDLADLAKVVEFKRRGEEVLRLSGLGYTIIRPGLLVSEPGGYKALVFDQGGRITESISAADVADICLKSLHEPAARNKTFDVCYEFQTEEGLEMYELVAHAPSASGGNSYLKAAVGSLAKNT